MGIRSEIQYNKPGLVRKTVIAAAAVGVLHALIKSAAPRRQPSRWRY